tara:strand:+ start:2444 stop:2965 length:522 start_codon:yes stop_codon:yes gene_type:complete
VSDPQTSKTRRSSPAFGAFDPGWLFVLLGMIVLSAGILIPAIQENRVLGEQLRLARQMESRSQQHLTRSTSLLDQMYRDDATLRRIWNADLNRTPQGSEPVLRDLEAPSDVLQWLDASAGQSVLLSEASSEIELQPSLLERMASGPRRLWFLGAGGMCLCVGLVMGPTVTGRD